MGSTRRELGRDDLIASVHPLARVNREGVARVPFPERVAGAAAAGFAAVGSSPRDYLGILATGLSDDDIASVLDEHDMVIGEIDSCPLWTGAGEPDDEHRRLTDVVFHMAERFGPVHHAVVPLGTDGLALPAPEVLAPRLDALAERAAPLGLRLAAEFVPWGQIADVGAAWDLARRSPSPLVGITIDFWHHLAGRADAEMVRTVPGERVHAVHFTDGSPDLSEPDPLRRTQRQRKVPGEGVFPMVDTIRLLDEIGADLPFTVEVVSLDHRDLSPTEFLVVLHEAARRVLDEARAVPGGGADVEQRKVGGLAVSVMGIGCNQFGPTCDDARTAEVVHAALDAGINFFDTADEYGPEGVSEELLGRALGGRRDEAVIATKFGHFMDGDPERGGASARWIERAVEDSLRRLGTDRIDLYQQHFPDPDVPAEETLTALDRLVRAGKVREIGCCNLGADDLDERAALADEKGLTRLASAQNRLNLLRQEAIDDLVPAVERNGMVLLPFFPLASGMLTGKYRRGEALPSGTRFANHLEPAQAERIVERDGARVEALGAWAAERGHTVAELALAWLVAQPSVASVIAGATSAGQVASNAGAAQWRLTPDEAAEVAKLGQG